MYVGTNLTQLCVLSERNRSLAWNGNYWVLAPNKDVHQSGEQFDAPNMLLPSAAGTVRFLLPSHAKQEHSTLFRRDLFSWRLGLGQAVSGGCCCVLPLFRSVVPSTYQLLVHFSLHPFLDAEIHQQLQSPHRSG